MYQNSTTKGMKMICIKSPILIKINCTFNTWSKGEFIVKINNVEFFVKINLDTYILIMVYR